MTGGRLKAEKNMQTEAATLNFEIRKIGDTQYQLGDSRRQLTGYGISIQGKHYVQIEGESYCFGTEDSFTQAKMENTSEKSKHITAPMPGKVVKVCCKTGDPVKTNDCLMIIESMKMETEIFAEVDGKVATCPFNEGDQFSQGDLLISLE